MNANILKPRALGGGRQPRTGSSRKSRSFRPTSEGLEQRLQLSGLTATAVSGLTHTGPGTTVPITIITPPPPLADLAVESLNVQNLGNNQFKLTATLEDLPTQLTIHADGITTVPVSLPGVPYPGGGVLSIMRTDGGRTISQQPNGTVLDTPDPVQTLATMPIPWLAPGQTVQLSTVTTGRALYTATAGPAFILPGHPLPFPETNPLNDTLTVDNLISHTLPINTTTLAFDSTLVSAVQHAQFRLDAANSSVVIPGFVNEQFKIPGQTVSIGIGPISDSVTYTVNNLVSTSTALTYEQGGLALTVNFANNQHALHTTSSIAPDIGVTNLQVKVVLPLSYDANGQYFNFTNPKVTVTGNWSANGLLGPVFDLLLPNINAKIESNLTSVLQPELGPLAFQLNNSFHGLTAGGRIVSADIQQTQMIVNVETPS